MRRSVEGPANLSLSITPEKGAAEADYLESMCIELAAIAKKARFEELAGALSVAAKEAQRVALGHNVKVCRDESSA